MRFFTAERAGLIKRDDDEIIANGKHLGRCSYRDHHPQIGESRARARSATTAWLRDDVAGTHDLYEYRFEVHAIPRSGRP